MSLQFDIGGNVSGAVEGLKRVNKELQIVAVGSEKFGLKLQNLQQKVAHFGGGVRPFVSGLSLINKEFASLQKQVTFFGGGVRSFTSNFANIKPAIDGAGDALKRYQTTSNAAMQTSINFGRIIQDAPFGFLGVANNINPVLESYQRLRAQTGSTGAALKALGSSLTGAGGVGLALSIVSSALILFGDKLTGASRSVSDAEIEATKFARSLASIKDGIDALQNFIEFQASLDKLRLKLKFGEGFRANIGGLSVDLNKNKQIIDQNTDLIARGIKKISALEDQVTFFGGASAKALLTEFRSELDAIPDDMIKKLGRVDRERLQQIKQLGTEKKALESQRSAASEANSLIEVQIQIEQNAELKRLYEKDKAAYEKYVSDTIARGKALAGFFSDIAVVPKFSAIDSTLEQFRKAQQIIQEYANANLIITYPVRVDEKSVEAPANREFPSATFEQMFGKPKVSTDPTDFSLLAVLRDWADLERAKAEAARMAEQIGSTIKNAMTESLAGVGQSIGEIFTGGDIRGAFQAFAQTIGGALQAIGKQLIAIGTAALLAKEALKKLFANPAVAIAAGVALVAAGAAMKNVLGRGLSGRAAGGGVAANTPYVVGENRPEIFIPSTTGRIIPNTSLAGLAGAAAQMIEVFVTGRFDGDGMVLAVEKTKQKQSRY